MTYANVLPVAYEINTFTLVQGDVFSEFANYRGNTDDGKDISKRCEIMNNAVDIAYARAGEHDGGRSSETLKLFMAPEFYFRGKKGAYPLEVLCEIMPTLREHTKQAKFEHWLFVFGTAIGRIETEDGKLEILNVALVQKGGVQHADGVNERVIYKEYISAIDFPGPKFSNHKDWENPVHRRVSVGVDGVRGILPVDGSMDPIKPDQLDKTPGLEYSVPGMRGTLEGRCVFTQDDVCIGLEICRDHLLGRLKMTPPDVGDSIVQLHLIPSAGASIKQQYVSGRTGTIAFNVDGGSRSDLRVKRGPSVCGGSIAASGSYDISLKSSSWWTVTHDKYFGEYGRIKLYPKQLLRAAETNTV